MKGHRGQVSSVALSAFCFLACATSSESSRQTGTPATNTPATMASECSNGAPYESTLALPFADHSDEASLRECVPRCGAAVSEGFYNIDALPQGACSGVVRCKLAARERCPDATVKGPITSFRCECSESMWRCAILSRGAATCSGIGTAGVAPPGSDAGSGNEGCSTGE